jgi:hypothetical protein
MQFVIHKRDTAVMDHLEACARAASADHLPLEVREKLQQTALDYRSHFDQLQLARLRHRSSCKALRMAEEHLRRRLRHVFQAVRRHRDSLLDHSFDPQNFGLSAKGTLPAKLQYIREPVEVARGVLAQQALLDLNGIRVLRDPDPEELTALIDEVLRLRLQCAPRREAEIAAKTLMDGLRDRANRLLRMIRHYLQTMIEITDERELRALLRSYGYSFVGQSPAMPTAESDPIKDEGNSYLKAKSGEPPTLASVEQSITNHPTEAAGSTVLRRTRNAAGLRPNRRHLSIKGHLPIQRYRRSRSSSRATCRERLIE